MCRAVVHDFTGFITEPNKGIMKKRLWIWGKKMRVKGFEIWLLKLIDTTPEKCTEAHVIEMSTSEPVPHDKKEDIEEAVPENRLTLDSLAEGF